MDNLLIGAGQILTVVVLAVLFANEVLASGRLEPRFRLGRPAADAIKAVCFSIGVPLFTAVFLASPHTWGPQDFRNSMEFRGGMATVVGLLEVPLVIATVRAIRKWQMG